jgi:hypothetical protein
MHLVLVVVLLVIILIYSIKQLKKLILVFVYDLSCLPIYDFYKFPMIFYKNRIFSIPGVNYIILVDICKRDRCSCAVYKNRDIFVKIIKFL